MHFISKSLSGSSAFLTIKVKQDRSSNGNLVELNFSDGSGIGKDESARTRKTVKVPPNGEVTLYSSASAKGSDYGGGVQIAIDAVGFAIKGATAGCCGCLRAPAEADPKTDADGLRHVLRSVSGVHEAGRLLAVLGPSGAGKTTFLNI